MRYLLMDIHRRFLGTFVSPKKFAIGDTFQSDSAANYAVIGVDWGGSRNQSYPHSLIVIPTAAPEKALATSISA